MIGYVEVIIAILCFLIICHWSGTRKSPAPNWPVLGMLPDLLCNASDVHEYATKLLKRSGGTFEFRGPWMANLNFVVTSDPMNVQHMLSKNFANYRKGSEFKELFDPFGDGIFSSDSESWKNQRKMIHSLIKNRKFETLFEETIQKKIVTGLIPILEHVAEQGMEVDIQDVFQRFAFDNICLFVLGTDPHSMSVNFPEVQYEKALGDMEEAVLHRHIVPKSLWKLQRWLQIGEEKKLSRAQYIFDAFLYQSIRSKQQELSRNKIQMNQVEKEVEFDLLTAYITEEVDLQDSDMAASLKSDKFLRDTAFNLMVAGRDTVSAGLVWFFWLVATHPTVENKILEEIKANLTGKQDENLSFLSTVEDLNKLTYLHGAICESLRLHSPVPFLLQFAIQPDVLPSGIHVAQKKMVMYSPYSMGRMEGIWGKDCLEFKPERWISERGGIIHVPSYKFITFNSGPRSCLGKDMSFIEMKMVATSVLRNYHIQVVEGHPVSPSNSIILHMKHGLKVRVSRRSCPT